MIFRAISHSSCSSHRWLSLPSCCSLLIAHSLDPPRLENRTKPVASESWQTPARSQTSTTNAASWHPVTGLALHLPVLPPTIVSSPLLSTCTFPLDAEVEA